LSHFALHIATFVCFSNPGGLILFHQDIYMKKAVFPEARKCFPPTHRHISSMLKYVLCHTVKFSCITVYTWIWSTGLGYKRNVLISVPFVNRGKLHHMSGSGKALM